MSDKPRGDSAPWKRAFRDCAAIVQNMAAPYSSWTVDVEDWALHHGREITQDAVESIGRIGRETLVHEDPHRDVEVRRISNAVDLSVEDVLGKFIEVVADTTHGFTLDICEYKIELRTTSFLIGPAVKQMRDRAIWIPG